MKDVQCYELFGGTALKNHEFSFFYFIYEKRKRKKHENVIFCQRSSASDLDDADRIGWKCRMRPVGLKMPLALFTAFLKVWWWCGGVDPIPCVSTHRISDPRSGPAKLLPTRQAAQLPPRGPSTNPRPLVFLKVFSACSTVLVSPPSA